MRELHGHAAVRDTSSSPSFVRAVCCLLLSALLVPAATATSQSAGQIQYFYDALGRLIEVIDQSGNAAIYTYDQVGNLLSITRLASTQVAIAGVSPGSGPVGSTVTISGTGFGASSGTNSVSFNGTQATVISESGTSLVVAVPAGATTGPISVTAPLGTAVSAAPFAVTVPTAGPTITGIAPQIVVPGDTVTVTGTGFDLAVVRDVLTVNQRSVAVATATATELTFVVPASATSGHLKLATPTGSVVSTEDLFVVPPPYSVASVDAAVRAQFGQPQTVNFNGNGHLALVLFDGAPQRRVSVDVTGTISADYSVYHPNGGIVADFWFSSPGFIDVINADAMTTYTLLLRNSYSTMGSLTFTPFDVPPDATATATVGGSAVTLTTTTPGQNAALRFSGQAGQHVGVQLSGVTIPSMYWSIRQPNSQRMTEENYIDSTDPADRQFLDIILPVSGTYSVYFDPDEENTGSVTALVAAVPNDITGTIQPGGPPVTVTTTSVGQNASLTFTGTAGQRIALLMTNFATMGYETVVSVVRPDGSYLVAPNQMYSGNDFRDTVTLPASGTYTIVIDPFEGHFGSLTVALFDVPPDVASTISIGGSPQTATLVTGQNASLTFSGTAGQQITLQLTAVTIASSVVSILKPDGTQLAYASVGTSGGAILNKTLSATGTYTIVEDPQRTNSGNMTLTLVDASDVVGAITPGGPPVSVTISALGQRARLTFGGTAQQKVSLRATSSTFAGSLALLRPDGTTLSSSSFSTGGGFLDTQTLPAAGTYTFLITPSGSQTGSLTLTAYDVVDVTGSITMGTPIPVSISTPGQNGRLTFNVVAGQRVSLQATSVSGATGTMAILKPDGTTLASATVSASGAFIDGTTVPLDGTYTVLANPSGTNTGSLTLTLRDVSDVTGTITPGGSAVTVTISNAGQNAQLTFAGTAGQSVSLRITSVTIGSSTTVSILRPDQTTLTSKSVTTSGGFIDTQVLPTTGTYTVLVNPSSTNVGNATLTLYDIVDVTGALTVNGGGVPITITTAGQNALFTFAGTASQLATVRITSNTASTITVKLLKPDGTQQTSSTSSASSFNVPQQTLAVTGTYTVVVDPSGTNTGSLTVAVTNP